MLFPNYLLGIPVPGIPDWEQIVPELRWVHSLMGLEIQQKGSKYCFEFAGIQYEKSTLPEAVAAAENLMKS